MIGDTWPLMVLLLGVGALWTRAAGRIYVRRTRSGKWAYGIHDGPIRLHYGTRPTWADAMTHAQRHIPRPQ